MFVSTAGFYKNKNKKDLITFSEVNKELMKMIKVFIFNQSLVKLNVKKKQHGGTPEMSESHTTLKCNKGSE